MIKLPFDYEEWKRSEECYPRRVGSAGVARSGGSLDQSDKAIKKNPAVRLFRAVWRGQHEQGWRSGRGSNPRPPT